MTGITWLHLSDWHEGKPNFQRTNLLQNLIEDISNRTGWSDNSQSELEKIDFIVFSGDVAFSGEKPQYEAAQQNFFDKILQATGLTAESLFIVPGNHDIDRNRINKYLPSGLTNFNSSLDSNNLESWMKIWLDEDESRPFLFIPFFAYQEFVRNYTGQNNPVYGSTKIFNINGKRVALLGLNSALMSARNIRETQAGEKIVEDKGKLIVGDRQIFYRLPKIETCDLRIAVLHHPLEELSELERNPIIQTLKSNFHFILCGHQHIPGIDLVRGISSRSIISAGALYQTSAYPNSYNFVHLDTETGQARIYLRSWENIAGQFMWTNLRYTDNSDNVNQTGEYLFSLAPETLKPINHPINHRSIVQPSVSGHCKKHCQVLSQAILRGVVVPFLGADINLCDRPNQNEDYKPSDWQLEGEYPPTNLEIAAHLDRETASILDGEQDSYLRGFRCPFIPGSSLDPENLPDGFPHECPLNTKRITRLDLSHVSQYMSSKLPISSSADRLETAINAIYEQNSYSLNSVHKFLVNLCKSINYTGVDLVDDEKLCLEVYPRNDINSDDEKSFAATPYPLIVTTCFDRTLEIAFENAKQPFDLVSFSRDGKAFIYQKFDKNNEEKIKYEYMPKEPVCIDTQNKDKICDCEQRPVILRLYGRAYLENPEKGRDFAITEDHFIDYLACNVSNKLPTTLWKKLTQGYLWFLGYSLSYWNLRFIVRQIEEKSKSGARNQTRWAIQENPEILDKKLWENNKSTFYGKQDIISFKEYIKQLTKQLRIELEKLPKP